MTDIIECVFEVADGFVLGWSAKFAEESRAVEFVWVVFGIHLLMASLGFINIHIASIVSLVTNNFPSSSLAMVL